MVNYAIWSLAALLGLATPALAESCRLALVLALDVSASVDAREDHLQRQGLARALLTPEVVQAFLAGEAVALYVFEWSGPYHQVTLAPGWQMVEREEDLSRIAATITASRPDTARTTRSTAVDSALGYAAMALSEGPRCRARTVDIAGDGANNQGDDPALFYEWPHFTGVTVNALVITGSQPDGGPLADVLDGALVNWFEVEVLRGPGAFVEIADGYEDFERAMIAKLLRELEPMLASGATLIRDGAQ